MPKYLKPEILIRIIQKLSPYPRETHCICIKKTKRLMLFREIVAVCCGEIYEAHKYDVW